MIKSAGKKLLVAVLGICAALTMIFGVANFNRNGKITAKADSSTLSLLNLSKGHTDNEGSGFSAENTILIHWADGSQSGSTWGCLNLKCGETDLSDLVVVATAEKSQTLKQWNAEKCITRAITYGQMFGINLEESGLQKSQVVSVTLKAGFAPITDASGWGNNDAKVGTADLTKALPEDVKLWLNHTYGTLELDSTALKVTSQPETTEYLTGSTFKAKGLAVTATTVLNGDVNLDISKLTYSYDFSTAGQKAVTISYGGQTATVDVTVNEKAVPVTGITVKDNAKLFLKQYSLKTELTPDAKLTVSYSNGTSNDVDLTIDMVSGYTNETVGTDKEATVTYEGQTCKIKYDVAAYTGTSYFKGVNYGPIYGTEGTGYATLDGIDDVNAELKALWDVDKAPSLVMGKTNGDLVTINGVTLTQLVTDKQYASYRFARMLMNGRNFAFHIDDATFMNTVKNGAEICFLPGFSWVTYTEDKWGDSSQCANYTPIENAVITKPTYFCFKNGNVCKVIDSVTLVGTPKASYYTGDVIDVTGLKLSVKYKGFDAEEIALTADMCEYDFREAGNDKTVSITYDGKTVTFNVNVEAVNLTDVKLVTAPDKKDYDFGIENELDLNGLVVKAKYSNNTEANIPLDSLTVTGFDSRKFGVQTITAKYGDFEVTFEIEVKNISDDKYISIDYTSAATSYEGTQHNSLVVSFTFTGTYEKLNSYWGADKLDYVGDYMLINGTPVSKLIKEGKVTRLAVWASQIVIHLDTVKLVPATWVDKRDADHPDALHYVEGVSEVVETVTFLPGFQWYTVNGIDSSTLWGNDNAYLSATPIEGAVLKEKITIRNEDGYGWTRPLKRTDGVVDADALTVASLPNKTTYTVGDRFEANGLQIRLKYQDGGEELITPGASELGYKKDVKGKQTLTFKYDGATASFEVTVKEPAAEKKGCGGSIGAIGVSSLGLLAFAFAFKRKRK